MTAAEHITFLDMILTQYALKLEDLVAIACDNMETNRANSKRIGVPMIGCAAHRFNLAVKDHVKDKRDVINKVSAMMKKLRTVKRRAVLKKHGCKYRPVPIHELRWSGLHRMLKLRRITNVPAAASAAATRTRVSAAKKPANRSAVKKSTTKKRAATVALPSPAQNRRRSPELKFRTFDPTISRRTLVQREKT